MRVPRGMSYVMSYAISTDQKKRYKRILSLGLPIVGGMISQNVINLVDTAMVGSLGDVALAAVGTGSFIAFMAVSVVMLTQISGTS